MQQFEIIAQTTTAVPIESYHTERIKETRLWGKLATNPGSIIGRRKGSVYSLEALPQFYTAMFFLWGNMARA